MFRLKRKASSAVRVQKIEILSNMASKGAKILRISPDKRWLLTVRPDNEIHLYRITKNMGTRGGYALNERSVHLSRLHRKAAEKRSIHSSLGSYDRSINRVSFSSNSRILAVSDLSGYIDTWVLEGHEDFRQEAENGVNGSATIESSDDGDSDAGQEPHSALVLGQQWNRNPAAELLPKLPAAPLFLDFRPSTTTYSSLTDRDTAVNPNRNNPHVRTHDLPLSEGRLFVFTSEHHMYEFEVLAGRLSDWSRRNPTTSLPSKFRELRERAMGAMWDMGGTEQRIWLYGSSWLWMFDLSKDLEPPADQSQAAEEKEMPGHSKALKRKRRADANSPPGLSKGLRIRDSGAGGRIPEDEIMLGVGDRLRKINGARPDNSQLIDLGLEHGASESEEDDVATGPISVKLRGVDTDESFDGTLNTKGVGQTDGETQAVTRPSAGPPYWSTYMYRPILGIVPLSGRTTREKEVMDQYYQGDQDDDCIEVALVERPMEEVDLPPRYDGPQDGHGET